VTGHIVVIGGGRNCEHEVGLASAAGVTTGLRDGGHSVEELTIDRRGRWIDALGRDIGLAGAVTRLAHADVVFPAVHGPLGEDGTLAALCALAGVAVVGSPVGAGAIGMDKWATKSAAAALAIRTAEGSLLTDPDAPFAGPCVVKPVRAGSSHGVSLVRSADDWAPALKSAFALDARVLVEEIQVGREIDVAVLRRADGSLLVGPPLEIVGDGIFDTDTKYDGSARFVIPAPLDEDALERLHDAATGLFGALGCAGVVRIDFFLTADGWVLNEVNTMPGMTEQSQVPKMFAAIGIGYPALLAELVAGAL
jgi:D-alanine-D-alanine ligase